MKFTTAIVRLPCPRITEGLTNANLGKPIYDKAFKQHQAYIQALTYCGLEVVVLEASNEFPDSTFIEDVALCTPHCAILSNPGASSRKGEVNLIDGVLDPWYKNIERIEGDGTVEPGDIMMVGNHFYIGLSKRTNHKGATQLLEILEKYGMTGEIVPLSEMLHLKTGLSYLENNVLVAAGEFINHPVFQKFDCITVDEKEAYAANCVWINDKVLVPANHPKTKQKIEEKGYEVIELEMSEFQKVDGGLSCLSLRF